ncbi:hypothetical protein [Natronoarchaeum rubrum]|uniref:hypothetical protein n=1 Tax=Natronoarchaeum rubrum TaxID=755311 RepID=UPI00211320D4|nr:hypothetical protein [Natronoarchaeum rubrum]
MEFVLGSSADNDVQSGRPPSGGSVRISTSKGVEEYSLTLFTRSVEQVLDAVLVMLRDGHGGVSTHDEAYLIFELEDEHLGHVTLCYSRDAIEDPQQRVVPRDQRSLDAVVPLPLLVDEVIASVADLLDRIEHVNESVVEREWFRDLNADLDEVREVADEHLQ